MSTPDWQALPLIQDLLTRLAAHSIIFCHWKSNYHIREALTGLEDLDILVKARDFAGFSQVVLALGFKPADSVSSRYQPGVFHFLGHDAASGRLVNVHAYTRILTGDHFLKSWALPFEALLLEDVQRVQGMPLPARSSDLIVFVIRNMLKYASLFDVVWTLPGTQADISEELAWIDIESHLEPALNQLARYFPELPADDFRRAVFLLQQPGRMRDKLYYGWRFKQALGQYRRYTGWTCWLPTMTILTRMVCNRYYHRTKHMQLHAGGRIIAVVGPQATGKSTVIAALRDWLGSELSVRTLHAGKPPATCWTALPDRLIPLVRRLLPDKKTIMIETRAEQQETFCYPAIFLIRKLLLAHERRSVLRSAYRASRNGWLVISDRYPSDQPGSIDSASFTDQAIGSETSACKRCLMRWERSLYARICPPDLVIQLTVPLDVALERNRMRHKQGKQSAEYVRLRHQMQGTPAFLRCPVITVSTDQALPDTLAQIQQAIWMHL